MKSSRLEECPNARLSLTTIPFPDFSAKSSTGYTTLMPTTIITTLLIWTECQSRLAKEFGSYEMEILQMAKNQLMEPGFSLMNYSQYVTV